nr:uncharacterized protein LOC124810173 [Hydra vulgaris]
MSYWTKRRKIRGEVQHILTEIIDTEKRNIDVREKWATASLSPQLSETLVVSVTELSSQTPLFNPLFNNCSETSENFASPLGDVDEYDEVENAIMSDSESDQSSQFSMMEELVTDLASWSCSFNITLTALAALLTILRKICPDLPKSPKTVMQSEIYKKEVRDSSYCYFGIKQGIVNRLSQLVAKGTTVNQVIMLQFNIDGLPLFKSSKIQLWPILCLMEHFDGVVQTNREPFTVALYCGNSKPTDINAFLKDFVEEIKDLQETGIIFNNVCYEIKISALVCDTPARAFIKCIKGHSAYHGCDKCVQHGFYAGRTTFPETAAALRTDSSFLEMKDQKHHYGKSPLVAIPSLGMISQVPADYMHLVCLGVMKKMVFMWLKGPLATRLGPRVVKDLSEKLVDMRPYIPSEFARKPRPFHEFERWKATEFRQLLLYTGMVCFDRILSPPLYNNFMLLSVAMSILLSEFLCKKYASYAHSLLLLFVEHVSEVYGKEVITYNMHGLVHLSNDAKKFGPLDNISSFPFENYLSQLKKLVRKPHMPLQQIVRRLGEKRAIQQKQKNESEHNSTYFKKEHYNGPVVKSLKVCAQYKELFTKRWCIKITDGDNCFSLNNGKVIIVQNIVKTAEQSFILYKQFKKLEDFFTYPCCSMKVDIFKVSCLENELLYCSPTEIKRKYVCLPIDNDYAVIPMMQF